MGWDFPHCTHTRICVVSHKTHGITLTHGILIIKIIVIIILQYLERKEYYEMTVTHTH
jgi:hypothetical protein